MTSLESEHPLKHGMAAHDVEDDYPEIEVETDGGKKRFSEESGKDKALEAKPAAAEPIAEADAAESHLAQPLAPEPDTELPPPAEKWRQRKTPEQVRAYLEQARAEAYNRRLTIFQDHLRDIIAPAVASEGADIVEELAAEEGKGEGIVAKLAKQRETREGMVERLRTAIRSERLDIASKNALMRWWINNTMPEGTREKAITMLAAIPKTADRVLRDQKFNEVLDKIEAMGKTYRLRFAKQDLWAEIKHQTRLAKKPRAGNDEVMAFIGRLTRPLPEVVGQRESLLAAYNESNLSEDQMRDSVAAIYQKVIDEMSPEEMIAARDELHTIRKTGRSIFNAREEARKAQLSAQAAEAVAGAWR